jgi:hypothetical protein
LYKKVAKFVTRKLNEKIGFSYYMYIRHVPQNVLIVLWKELKIANRRIWTQLEREEWLIWQKLNVGYWIFGYNVLLHNIESSLNHKKCD